MLWIHSPMQIMVCSLACVMSGHIFITRPNVMVVLVKLTTKPLSKNLAFDLWTSTYLCGQKPCLKVRDYLKLNEHVSNILSKFHLVVKWSTNIHYSHTIPILYEVLYAFYNIFHILHGYWFARFGLSIWKYHLILLINMPIKKPLRWAPILCRAH